MIENEKLKMRNSPPSSLRFLKKVQYNQAIKGVRSQRKEPTQNSLLNQNQTSIEEMRKTQNKFKMQNEAHEN